MSTTPSLKVLAVSGELDLASSPELRRRVDAALHDGADGIVIDLEEVRHLDSSGLAELIGAHQRAKERDSKVVLVLSSQPIRRTLEIRGLASLFTMAPSRDEAVAALDGSARGPA